MKTEVRKEHGDWIVFVDGNPQFSFMYREEAEKARNMIDALLQAKKELLHLYDILDIEGDSTWNVENINKALKDIGAI